MKPSGIGGWLLLPAAGLIITPVVMLVALVRDLLPVLSPAIWGALTTKGSENYHPMWAATIVYEAVASLALLALTLWLGYLFARKSWRTPSVFISWLVINVAVQVFTQRDELAQAPLGL